MSRFGRRRTAPEPQEAPGEAAETRAEATVDFELQPARAQGTYRIAVAHADVEHPNAAPAHWGPAYNTSFADTVAHIKGISAGQVDLLEEAKAGADRCREEHGGHEVWVERLVTRGEQSEWERVS